MDEKRIISVCNFCGTKLTEINKPLQSEVKELSEKVKKMEKDKKLWKDCYNSIADYSNLFFDGHREAKTNDEVLELARKYVTHQLTPKTPNTDKGEVKNG